MTPTAATDGIRTASRVAALYDVHGNLPALEAVLAEVAAADVDRVVVGGDVVPGPMPRACLDRLESLPMPVDVLAGNGEADVVALDRGAMPARVPEAVHPVLDWVRAKLSPGRLRELADWPATVRLRVEGIGEVLFCHATPRDDNEIFTVRTPAEALSRAFRGVDADLVVCGHTHMAFDRRVGPLRVVNAGSVGMPFGSAEARWLLLGPDLVPCRTPYDVGAAVHRIAATGYPGTLPLEDPPAEEDMIARFEAVAVGSGPAAGGGG